MSDEKQEGQKTIVSFIVGLLIGGLLVWAFSGPEVNAPTDADKKADSEKSESKDSEKEETNNTEAESEEVTTPEVATLPVGDGKVTVENQAAGSFVTLTSATYPVSEGWIGVREYQDEKLGGLLGVARFSEAQGLVPTGVTLVRATTAGKNYAVVVYTESGDLKFSLADDKQLDSVFATFTAQ
jgi:hypothetical protein